MQLHEMKLWQVMIFRLYILYNKHKMIKIGTQNREISQVLSQVLEYFFCRLYSGGTTEISLNYTSYTEIHRIEIWRAGGESNVKCDVIVIILGHPFLVVLVVWAGAQFCWKTYGLPRGTVVIQDLITLSNTLA